MLVIKLEVLIEFVLAVKELLAKEALLVALERRVIRVTLSRVLHQLLPGKELPLVAKHLSMIEADVAERTDR